MLSFTEFRRIRKTYIDFETRSQCRLIWNKYIQMKKKMNIDCVAITSGSVFTTTGWTMPCSLDTFGVTPEMYGVKQEEGNNPMNYATATVQAGTTETQDQRKYLTQRLENVYYEKEAPLYADFGLTDDRPPQTPKELKKRIEEGKFIINGLPKDDEDEDEECMYFGSLASMIKWRDPAKKADMDGYESARKELMDLRQKTLDIIKIDEPKAGLDAIKALEAWEPTGAAN